MKIPVIVLIFLLNLFSNFLSRPLCASEIQWSVQHVKLQKQNLSGWQHDLYGKKDLSADLNVGLKGAYLERFSLYDTNYGGFVGYKFNKQLYVEVVYTQGMGNQILTKRQTTLINYYALMEGFTPFLILKDSRYSNTTVQDALLGMEVEKWPHFLFIPQFTLGSSKFKSDQTHESIYSYSLKVIYYTENKFSLFIYGSRATEASQGINGNVTNNFNITSTTGGIGGSYNFLDSLKMEFSIDHTHYKELKNQYITSLFSLTQKF